MNGLGSHMDPVIVCIGRSGVSCFSSKAAIESGLAGHPTIKPQASEEGLS